MIDRRDKYAPDEAKGNAPNLRVSNECQLPFRIAAQLGRTTEMKAVSNVNPQLVHQLFANRRIADSPDREGFAHLRNRVVAKDELVGAELVHRWRSVTTLHGHSASFAA